MHGTLRTTARIRRAGALPLAAALAAALLPEAGAAGDAGCCTAAANLRWAVDLSSRTVASDNDAWFLHAVGLDLHTVVTGPRGDVGTLTFQPYLLRVDDAASPPALFDDGNDWALQWRVANFNYTGIGRGRFNLRIGHFELPFGLEQIEQTNGTLYQMNSPRALGLKADWGAGINGVLPGAEYELAWTLGSGNGIETGGGIASGRVGTSIGYRWRLGVSFLNGRQTVPVETERERYGIDVSFTIAPGLDVAAELADGSDQGEPVSHRLAQLRWTDPMQALTAYAQLRESLRRPDDGRETLRDATAGLRLEPNTRWSLSAELTRTIGKPPAGAPDRVVAAQFRYRL